MAIVGYLKNITRNNKFNGLIKAGLEYLVHLNEGDFENINLNGSVIKKIKGDKLFSINQTYKTKDYLKPKFEGHRKYIDLQYIFSGEELIKIAPIKDCRPVSKYGAKKDAKFFEAKSYSTLLMKKGMIAVFYPDDIHAPALNSGKERLIKKSVIKVMINNAVSL